MSTIKKTSITNTTITLNLTWEEFCEKLEIPVNATVIQSIEECGWGAGSEASYDSLSSGTDVVVKWIEIEKN